MLERIINFDKNLFLLLNGAHSELFDIIMLWISTSKSWIFFYIILIIYILKIFGLKKGLIYILTIILSVGLSDFVASGLLKPFFLRLRPCYEPSLSGLVHTVKDCGGRFGFVSSHASTSFALAVGIGFVFGLRSLIYYMLISWAIIVSYSRIYLGVHYPLDIIGGAFIGTFISSIFFKLQPLIFKRQL